MQQITIGGLIPKNITVGGKRTSVRLENINWIALEEICTKEKVPMNELLTMVDRLRAENSNDNKNVVTRTSAIRNFITAYLYNDSIKMNKTKKKVPTRTSQELVQQIYLENYRG